jgi:hypothetical protein
MVAGDREDKNVSPAHDRDSGKATSERPHGDAHDGPVRTPQLTSLSRWLSDGNLFGANALYEIANETRTGAGARRPDALSGRPVAKPAK